MRCRLNVVLVIAIAVAVPKVFFAQATQSISESVPPRVTIVVRDSSIAYIVREIVRQSGTRLVVDGDYPLPTQRVSMRIVDRTTIEALTAVLRGTDLKARIAVDGTVLIHPARSSAEHSKDRAQDTASGTIVGHVLDRTRKQGLSMVNISINGIRLIAATGAKGEYTLRNVPAGQHFVSARLLGYDGRRQSVTVKGRDTVRLDFVLTAVPERLQEVVTTGSDLRKRVEVGNSIPIINADSIVPTTPLRNISDLIKARAPGVEVLSTSGTVGAGSRVRIRGVSSLLASSDPIVIIDGVRVDAAYSQDRAKSSASSSLSGAAYNGAGSPTSGGAQRVPATSRLNDIDPEMIESIEVLKGPSASTLYGSDAANGVIIIKTKRGKVGPTRWSVSGTTGRSSMDATFLDAWTGWGRSNGPVATETCTLAQQARRLCKQDSVTHFNPLNNKETSPFTAGTTQRVNGQVSGGTQQLQFFFGASLNDDKGVLRFPVALESKLLDERDGVPLPSWAKKPNIQKMMNVTGSLTSQVGSKADIAIQSNFTSNDHRDAAQGSTSIIPMSYTSMGYRDPVGLGWGEVGPINSFLQRTGDAVNRFNGGVSTNFRPTTQLSGRFTYGADYTNRHDETLLRPSEADALRPSVRGRSDSETRMHSADGGATLNLPITSSLRLRSSGGGQYVRTDYSAVQASVTGLVDGDDVLSNMYTGNIHVSEARDATATAAWYLEQSISLNERFFLTTALRGDVGSAFGRQARAILYPKFNGSWLVSQEPFFPQITALTNVRLRFAFGKAGTQPATSDRLRSYQTATGGLVKGTPALATSVITIGNTALRPERSSEIEAGLDLGLWNDRVTLDLTGYKKTTNDALVQRTLPLSVGITSRAENLGKVDNRGFEASASVRPISRAAVDWSLMLGVSHNENKLAKLGPTTMETATSTASRYVAGYPVGGFWAPVLVGYGDANGDGFIGPDEIQMSDSAVYVGQPLPKAEWSLHNTVALWSGRLTLATGFNFTQGLTQFNDALYSQCLAAKCRLINDPNSSLADQALAATMVYSASSVGGFSSGSNPYAAFEHVSWVRWNDLSLTVTAPSTVTRALRTRAATVSFMVRNLALWSNYRGADPEVNTLSIRNVIKDSGGIPQPRDWSIRVNLNY